MRSLLPSLLLFVSSPAFALAGPGEFREAGRFGLGVGAGTSTAGVSMKYFFNSGLALQGVVGAGYGSRSYNPGPGGGWDSSIAASADLLFEMPAFYETDGVNLAWSVGPGLGAWFDDDYAALAVAGAIGFEVNITAVPMDVVVEYRPRILIVPDVAADWWNLGAHVRYIF